MEMPTFDPEETIAAEWEPLKRLRRAVVMRWYQLPDRGWFGLTPLRKHILICGYPRGGTTMLLAMMEYAYSEARHFGKEVSGWRAATYSWRNHEMMISKMPKDILVLHRVQNFYRGRTAELKVIIVLRDPRDLLTSHHASHERDYFQDPDEWRLFHERCRYHRSAPNVINVRYEDLVADVAGTQQKIEAFVGKKTERPFEDFHKADQKNFDTRPLNGVRPVDRKGVGRWAKPEHRERIAEILRKVPDFPEILIELGYEKDAGWLDRWRANAPAAAAAAAT